MKDDDAREAIELENAAEARLRKVDADPSDAQNLAAARHLERLAAELRQLRGAPIYQEYLAISNWLDEFDGMADFEFRAFELRSRIGVDCDIQTGEHYLRALIELAEETF